VTRRGDLHYYSTTTGGPAQTVVMVGALSSAQVGAVWTAQDGVVYPRLQATRHLRPNIGVTERVLAGSMRRQWQDELNETGSASMVIPNEDPDSTVVNEGDVIVFTDDGWATFGWIVKEIERVQIARSEEIDQVTTYTGVGLLGLLAEALVYPQWGLHRKPLPMNDDRYFSWFSPDAGTPWFWGTATVIATYRELQSIDTWWSYQGVAIPADWPDPDAAWIWAAGATLEWAPPGDCYFTSTFIVPDGVTDIVVSLVVDNIAKMYFDGDMVGEATWGMDDTYPLEYFTEVTPGEHFIAVWVQQAPDEERFVGTYTHNPAGLLCTVLPSNGEEITGPPIHRSNDTWHILPYPAKAPGMTPGMAMWHCIYEAQFGRGSLPGLSITWNDDVDSDGNPWPVVGDIGTKIGTDLLTFFQELANTYVDFAMDPVNFRMHAWVKGMRGANKTGIDGSTGDVELYPVTDPTDPWSGNLAGLTFKRVD
jgi:hypothetical protein